MSFASLPLTALAQALTTSVTTSRTAAGLLAADGATPTPSDSSTSDVQQTVDQVAATTVDVLSVAWKTGTGVLIGVVLAFVIVVVLRGMGRRRALYTEITRYCRTALYVLSGLTGGYLAAQIAVADIETPTWATVGLHAALVAIILALTWLAVGLLKAVEASVVGAVRAAGDQGRANRVTTQMQILRRVASAIVVICGVVGVIATFPAARFAMGSLFASAGVVSVIAGLAAQSTLGNVFAGIQLATTDAIRVDDVVEANDLYGNIEEITLTYVVVKVWDERRLILPSTYFTQNPFTNWSRRTHQMIGVVKLQCDWRVPIAMMRAELARVVAASSVWDGRVAGLVITETSSQDVTVRITVSASNADDLWALQCHVRESLITWLQKSAPYALPRARVEVEHVDVSHDPTDEEVARLAEELVALQHPTNDPATTALTVSASSTADDPIGAARLRAATKGRSGLRRSHREKVRRRAILPPDVEGARSREATDDEVANGSAGRRHGRGESGGPEKGRARRRPRRGSGRREHVASQRGSQAETQVISAAERSAYLGEEDAVADPGSRGVQGSRRPQGPAGGSPQAHDADTAEQQAIRPAERSTTDAAAPEDPHADSTERRNAGPADLG